jgi:hypothetical protein
MNLPESFGKRFILPLIPEFLALDPKITLDIFLQDKRVGAPPSPDDLAHITVSFIRNWPQEGLCLGGLKISRTISPLRPETTSSSPT